MHFLELCKNSVSTDISTFLVFISRVDHLATIRTNIWMTIAFKKLFLQKNDLFYIFLPKTMQQSLMMSLAFNLSPSNVHNKTESIGFKVLLVK